MSDGSASDMDDTEPPEEEGRENILSDSSCNAEEESMHRDNCEGCSHERHFVACFKR